MLPLKANTPIDRPPPVTLILIAANIAVYLLSIRHGGGLLNGPDAHTVLRYGMTPHALASGRHRPGALPATATLFTAMFLHASILHLTVNLLFLWVFGPSVEAALGRFKFLAFYLVGGVAAVALQAALHPHATSPLIGSAGPITAVMAGYAVLYPRTKVIAVTFLLLLVTFVEVPARLVLGLWLGVQALFALTHLTDPLGGGGVAAYFPYVGGLLFGLLTIRLLVGHRRRALVNWP